MSPTHHPEPEDLAAYASGTSPEWVSLVVACHLTYCADCREEVRLLDDLGGVLLGDLRASDDALLAPPGELAAPRPTARPAPFPELSRIPYPLHQYVQGKPSFRFLAPGVQHVPLSLKANDVPARLLRFNPGLEVPPHHHRGLEMILVLDGEFEDYVTNEKYLTGDLSRREETKEHKTRVTGDDACTVLLVGSELSAPTTAWGKVVQLLTRV